MRRAAGALLLAVLFFAIAAQNLSEPGIEADEALFAMGNFTPSRVHYTAKVFGRVVPLMQMSYLGSLKSWLYAPLFALWDPSPALVRVPMVVAGAATVALTFLLMWRLAGARAAWVSGGLLAVDPSFVWTTRCDWGPVALQHLLTTAGTLAFVHGRLGLGGLLFGLALWNKATFLWTLAGLGAAALLSIMRKAEPRRASDGRAASSAGGLRALFPIRPALPPARRMAIAVLCFALGAYPLIRFNVSTRGRTAGDTAHWDASDLRGKALHVKSVLEGSALYGYMVRDADVAPWPRAGLAPWLVAAAAAIVLWKRQRTGIFFLTAGCVAWLVMALTRAAGGSAHHVVLLWPWPQMVAGAAAAAVPRLWIAAAVTAAVSLGVTGRHYVLLAREGADSPWSGAIYALHERLRAEPAAGVFINDWGIEEPLLLLSRGRLRMESSHDQPVERSVARPGWIFAGHVDGRQAFAGVNARIESAAGFRKESIAIIADRQGRPVFQIFRMLLGDRRKTEPGSRPPTARFLQGIEGRDRPFADWQSSEERP